MSNLKEKFEQVICERVGLNDFGTMEGQPEAASACVSVVIDMLEGMLEWDHEHANYFNRILDEKISQLKSLIQ